MDLGIISMRYAKALLKLACENGEDDKVYAEMQTLAASFNRVPTLQKALTNPVASAGEKERLLQLAICGQNSPSATSQAFIALIVKKKRTDVMMFVAHSFCSLYREKHHIIQARLVVPTEVEEKVVGQLRQVVERKSSGNIQFEMEVKPEIEGGFILEYGTYRLDASLRTQISKIKRQLTK